MLTGLQQELTPSCSPNELSKIAKETLYIGLSRAQSFLYIIDQPRIIKEIKKEPLN
jgi:ribosome biogenesis protein Nip4